MAPVSLEIPKFSHPSLILLASFDFGPRTPEFHILRQVPCFCQFSKHKPHKTKWNPQNPTNPNADTSVNRQKQNLSHFLRDTLVGHPYLTHWPGTTTTTQHSCGTFWLDMLIRHPCRTLLLDTLAGNPCWEILCDTCARRLAVHFGRTLLLDTLTWHACRTLLVDPLLGHSYLTRWFDTLAWHSCWTLLWILLPDTLVEHTCLTLWSDTLRKHSCAATVLWDKLDCAWEGLMAKAKTVAGGCKHKLNIQQTQPSPQTPQKGNGNPCQAATGKDRLPQPGHHRCQPPPREHPLGSTAAWEAAAFFPNHFHMKWPGGSRRSIWHINIHKYT